MYTYQINVGIQVAFSRLPPLLYDYNRNLRVKDIGLEFLTVSVIITPTKSPRTGFLVRKGPYRVALGNQVKLARAFFIRQICELLNWFFIRFSIFYERNIVIECQDKKNLGLVIECLLKPLDSLRNIGSLNIQ